MASERLTDLSGRLLRKIESVEVRLRRAETDRDRYRTQRDAAREALRDLWEWCDFPEEERAEWPEVREVLGDD